MKRIIWFLVLYAAFVVFIAATPWTEARPVQRTYPPSVCYHDGATYYELEAAALAWLLIDIQCNDGRYMP